MKLIVGLGNPGAKYAHTRHNAGFWLIDHLAKHWHTSIKTKKFESYCGEATVAGEKILLLKPQTFMNLSGEAVIAAKNFYKLSVLDLLVLHDDLDLLPGQIRFREKGSSGGHNGLNSLIGLLGLTEFARIKIGIGRPLDKEQVTDYVLQVPAPADHKLITDQFSSAEELVEKWLGAN